MGTNLRQIPEDVLLQAIAKVYKDTPARGTGYQIIWHKIFPIIFGEDPKDASDPRWDVLFAEGLPLLRRYEGRYCPDVEREKEKQKLLTGKYSMENHKKAAE